MRFLDPTNDVTFRKIFGNEQHQTALISLINAMLGLEGDRRAVSAVIANPYQVPKLETLKETIVDVRATDSAGREFVVEMQCRGGQAWMRRALYGTAKALVNQLSRGDEYYTLRPVYFIGILRFAVPWDSITEEAGLPRTALNAPRAYHSEHVLMNKITHEQSSYDLSMHLMELPRFTKTLDQCENIIDKWAWFFKHGKELSAVPAEMDDPGIRDAFMMAEQMGWTEEELLAFENAIQYHSLARLEIEGVAKKSREEGIELGREEGIELGREEGIELGREEGIELGREEGIELGRIAVYKQLLASGMSVQEVARLSGVDVATVASWREA